MKYLDELKPEDLKNKKVLLRVDFNVPMPKLTVPMPMLPCLKLSRQKLSAVPLETFRIKSHKPTLDYLLDSGAKVALVSHIDPPLDSFSSIAEQIGEVLGQTLTLVPHSELATMEVLFQASSVLLIDNIRQDFREEQNDEGLAFSLSKGFDIYVNDAFSVCHRKHASVSAVTKYLPSYAGFLVRKEIENLSRAVEMPAKGKVIVLGGVKISTKLPVIKNFLDKAEKILIGGAVANNFFKAQGINVGSSVVDDFVQPNWLIYDVDQLVLPEDVLITKDKTGEGGAEFYPVKDLDESHLIVDIGPETAKHFAETIVGAEMVIWNGPMGLAEVTAFAGGTQKIVQAVVSARYSIIGGGDTIAAADKLDLLSKFSYVSTGGGAMLAFLAGEKLPGLQALDYYD